MQGIVVVLERSGFVVRAPLPGHGRIQTTELTDRGGLLTAASGIVAGAAARLRQASTPLDPEAVAATLTRLAEALR